MIKKLYYLAPHCALGALSALAFIQPCLHAEQAENIALPNVALPVDAPSLESLRANLPVENQGLKQPAAAPDESEAVITIKEGAPESPLGFPGNRNKKKKIMFQYEHEDLINVINFIASQMGINIMLPHGPDAINAKLSLALPKKISLSEGWNILHTILDAAGYTIVPKADLFMIVRSSKDTFKQTLATYIGVAPEKLPATDETIRYLYYLANIRITKEADDEIKTALKAILPPTAFVEADTNANALLIVDKAQNIRAAMEIVIQLDQPGFQEKMELIRLRHTSAVTVAQLFTDQMLKTAAHEPNKYRLDAPKTSKEASYFSSFTKVIPVPRTNSLILLGRAQAIDRIKDFIYKYIDVELESGKSILHTYQLQYLAADQMVEVLNSIVESSGPAAAEQARAGKGAHTGAERFFSEKIYIKADGPMAGVSAKEKKYFGSNKLIIAARNDDWIELKKLIEQLDQPQPQVLLETLIADLTIDDIRQLGTFTRNPQKIPLPSQVAFEAAQLPPGGMTDSWTAPTTIDCDLLRKAISNSGAKDDAGPNSIAAIQNPVGGITVAFNDDDGATWSLARLLKVFNITKILSMPHILATHNKKASIQNTEIRIVRGPVTGTDTAEVKYIPLEASLKIELTPRIISESELNLDIVITIQEFLSNQNNRSTRTVQTLARVGNENILAIGGLIRNTTSQITNATPILSKVPILGWFFKNTNNQEGKTNLTVFIKPTIIMPRFRGNVNAYTQDYIRLAKAYSDEGSLFDSLHDPITRWFFNTNDDATAAVIDFMDKDEVLMEQMEKTREEAISSNGSVAVLDKGAISAQLKKQLSDKGSFEELIQEPQNASVAMRKAPAFDKRKDSQAIKRMIDQDSSKASPAA